MISLEQLGTDLGRVIRAAIVVILLIIFASIANVLPGVDEEIVSGLTILGAIRLGLVVISIVIIAAVAGALGTVLAYYANRLFKVYSDPVRARVAPNIRRASGGVASLIVIGLIWVLVSRSLPIIQRMEAFWEYDWLPTAVTLVFVAAVILVLIAVYRSSGPIFELVSGALSRQVVATSQVACPSCGSTNPTGVKFCTSCGAEIQAAAKPVETPELVRCQSCGVENAPQNRFCANCGAEIQVAGKPEETPESVRCQNCEAENAPQNTFCVNCGARLSEEGAEGRAEEGR